MVECWLPTEFDLLLGRNKAPSLPLCSLPKPCHEHFESPDHLPSQEKEIAANHGRPVQAHKCVFYPPAKNRRECKRLQAKPQQLKAALQKIELNYLTVVPDDRSVQSSLRFTLASTFPLVPQASPKDWRRRPARLQGWFRERPPDDLGAIQLQTNGCRKV